MDISNEQYNEFINAYNRIRYNDDASVNDIKIVLDHYNEESKSVDGIYQNYNINILEAACLNAKYKELTGQDHQRYVTEQLNILNNIIDNENLGSVNGEPSIYRKLRNNLTGESPGIAVLPRMKGSFIEAYSNIKYDMGNASLEDVTLILDYYDQTSVVVDNSVYNFRPNVLEGASLNARYKELTGHDHPVFARVQDSLLDKAIKDNTMFFSRKSSSIYQLLKDHKLEFGNNDHIVAKSSEIILNPEDASFEDISALLNTFNGLPVIINGIANYPFNDPITATKLNEIYKKTTGEDHPVYIEQLPKVVDTLFKSKKVLITSGVRDFSYFEQLKELKNNALRVARIKDAEQSNSFITKLRTIREELNSYLNKSKDNGMQLPTNNESEVDIGGIGK